MNQPLVYDWRADRAIVWGGFNGSGNDETWAYDFEANAWTNLQPAVAPAPRWAHAMAYDSQSGRVVLFGGATLEGVFEDTWAYDFGANTWANMSPAAMNPAYRW